MKGDKVVEVTEICSDFGLFFLFRNINFKFCIFLRIYSGLSRTLRSHSNILVISVCQSILKYKFLIIFFINSCSNQESCIVN